MATGALTKLAKHVASLILLLGTSGTNLINHKSNHLGSVSCSLASKLDRSLSVKDFGAIGDGTVHPITEWFTAGFTAYRGYANLAGVQVDYPHVTSATQSIDWAAGQAGLNALKLKPGVLQLHDLQLVITNTLTWKGGAFIQGTAGLCSIKLAAGANCNIIQSENFEAWAGWTVGTPNTGYTTDGGIDGVILDGNAAEQGAISTDLSNLVYGLKIHSHRFGIGWLQIRRVKGVGMLTQYNSALMYSFRTDGVDDYGLQGSPLGSPSPYDFKQINIIDTLYESFVFKGPADIPIWHLTTNYCGWLDNATIPTTPRTSLLFPGEEIHSVRIETACKLSYLNANGALYGYSLYVAGFVRLHADTVIESSSWGGVKIEGSAFGCISSLMVQQNSFAWGGVYKPGLETTPGTSSAANKNRFTITQLGLRRVTTPLTPNAIGPGILDNSGMQIGIIDGVDSNPSAGHGLVIGATNVGGIYESVNFDSIQGVAGDGTASAAVLIQEGARDWRINELRLTNCNRNLVNLGTNMRGIVRDGTIELNKDEVTGQIALEGVVAESQVVSVIAGTGNISVDNIKSWGLEILDKGKRYYNRFSTSVGFDGAVAGAQVSAVIPHTMWRKPGIRELQDSKVFGGTTWPLMSVGIRTFAVDSIIAAAFVHTTAAGTLTYGINLN